MNAVIRYRISMAFAIVTVLAAWAGFALATYHFFIDECTTLTMCVSG